MAHFFLISLSVYGLDFVTKFIVRKKMFLGQEISILPFFSLVHVENTGMAFGMFQGQNGFFIIAGLVLMGIIIYWGKKFLVEDRPTALILALVLGGALGNMTDRILMGRVTDFLDFYAGSYHWPAFNVADSAISVGAVLLIWRGIIQSRNQKNDINKG